MDYGYPDIVRYFNFALALICMFLLIRKGLLYWDRYQSRTKDYWWVLWCWSQAIFFTSLELLLHWDTSLRVFFTLAALLLTVKVLLKRNEADKPTFSDEL